MSEPLPDQLAAMVMMAAKAPKDDIVWKLYELQRPMGAQAQAVIQRGIAECLGVRVMMNAALNERNARINLLELALQEYMDIMRYADKESIIRAIQAADDKARALVPKRIAVNGPSAHE